jgi:hypothetical protein
MAEFYTDSHLYCHSMSDKCGKLLTLGRLQRIGWDFPSAQPSLGNSLKISRFVA